MMKSAEAAADVGARLPGRNTKNVVFSVAKGAFGWNEAQRAALIEEMNDSFYSRIDPNGHDRVVFYPSSVKPNLYLHVVEGAYNAKTNAVRVSSKALAEAKDWKKNKTPAMLLVAFDDTKLKAGGNRLDATDTATRDIVEVFGKNNVGIAYYTPVRKGNDRAMLTLRSNAVGRIFTLVGLKQQGSGNLAVVAPGPSGKLGKAKEGAGRLVRKLVGDELDHAEKLMVFTPERVIAAKELMEALSDIPDPEAKAECLANAFVGDPHLQTLMETLI